MNVRGGTADDARAAAELHAASISEGFLSSLGSRFLSGLYRAIARDERSFLFVAEDSHGTVVGMIAGTEQVSGLYRRFARREGLFVAVVTSPRLIRNLRSVLETWRYGRVDTSDLPPAELLSVAVTNDARRSGVGRQLVDALLREFERRGVKEAKVVIGAGNDDMSRLCRRMGFEDQTTISVHGGAQSEVMVWSSSPR